MRAARIDRPPLYLLAPEADTRKRLMIVRAIHRQNFVDCELVRGELGSWLSTRPPGYLAEESFGPNFMARSTSVRTPTPVAPFAFHGFTSSCQAVPAMSR